MIDSSLHQLFALAHDPGQIRQWVAINQMSVRELLPAIRDAILSLLDGDDVALIERAVLCAWELATTTSHPEDAAMAHWCQGLALLNRNATSALKHLDTAYTYFSAQNRLHEQGRLCIGRAGLLGQLGQLEHAEQVITEAAQCLADVPEAQERFPVLLLNRSDIEGRLGRYADMQATATQAEALALQHNDIPLQAKALINQAFAALFLGQFVCAEAALHKAQSAAQACHSAELTARVAVNLARLETYRGRLFSALRYLEQARADFATAQIDLDQATVMIEEASLYERLHLPVEARRIALAAAEEFARAGLLQEHAEALLQAARIALILEQPTLARRELERAQQVASALTPILKGLLLGYAAHPQLQRSPDARTSAFAQATQACAALAAAGGAVEQLEVGLIAAQLAAALRQPTAVLQFQQIAESAATHGLSMIEQHALVGCADLLRPKAATVALQRAVDLALAAQQNMPIEELKASYLSGLAPLYTRLIVAYLKAKQPLAACQTVLVAKGQLWAELSLAAGQAEDMAQVHDPTWVRAKAELDYWRHEAPQGAAHDALRRERIQQAEATLLNLARQQTRQRQALPLPNIKAIQHAMPAESMVIEYVIAAPRLFACLISPHTAPRWIDLGSLTPVVDRLGKLALQRAGLQRSTSPEQQQQSAAAQQPSTLRLLGELYDLLIAPLAPLPAQLTIVPDGLLFGLPWAALWNQPHGQYLAEEHELVIFPSAVLLALPRIPPSNAAPLALGYAGHPPLAHVPTELAAIQRAFPDTQCVNPAGLGDLAWTTAPQILHLAMHGHINPQSPLLSQLIFADGALLLADVLNLHVYGTALVTLSACDTATTPERGGVALALAGAFLTAGAQAVVASLWPVDDTATALMMEHLYAGLSAGQPISQALAHAQAHLRTFGYSHPYYWASFQALVRG